MNAAPTANAPLPAIAEKVKLLLVDNVARSIFERIFSSRNIRFNQLRAELEPGIAPTELKVHLKLLVDEELVASVDKAPIEEFQTYYVTRAGLTAGQRLHQLEAG